MADKRTVSLDGLIQTKGASRPDNLIQRVEAPSPARQAQDQLEAALNTSPAVPSSAPVAAAVTTTHEPRAKSLTLRLSETQYEQLRRHAFERRLSHQDIIERALMDHLAREGRAL